LEGDTSFLLSPQICGPNATCGCHFYCFARDFKFESGKEALLAAALRFRILDPDQQHFISYLMLHEAGQASTGRKAPATLRTPAAARLTLTPPPWSLKLLCAFAALLCVAMNGPLPIQASSVCWTPVDCVCPFGYKVKLSNPCQCVTCEIGECPNGVPQLYASCATLRCPAKRCKKQITYTCGKMSITCPPA
jgi:hypothetical protein